MIGQEALGCVGRFLPFNDIAAAGTFYDKVLATLGMRRVLDEPHELGYAGSDGRTTVFVVRPFDGQPATFGNGTQIMFYAPHAEGVNAFHAAALNNGGTDEGAPGPRHYHPDYYGAYVRDLDGNKLNVSLDLAGK
ncbi:VOC family protein [uncultured Roseibium sp.]|uniref:VOC family protein n=1 Tax=uncultured Roseibium sp. TaxID=1936171 RepID=UPI002603EF61|nr:VOC family protein [uncultured Roseibium sp.]